MKYILIIFLFICGNMQSFSQDIKIKKGEILIDGEKALTYQDDKHIFIIKVFDLKKNFVLSIVYKDSFEDYVELYFVKADLKLRSTVLAYDYYKRIIEKLINEEVLNREGEIDEDKLSLFIKTYE